MRVEEQLYVKDIRKKCRYVLTLLFQGRGIVQSEGAAADF
jgi:hypothetical protein